eukprot:jgi/Mesvir1/8857/Mv02754-RA.1
MSPTMPGIFDPAKCAAPGFSMSCQLAASMCVTSISCGNWSVARRSPSGLLRRHAYRTYDRRNSWSTRPLATSCTFSQEGLKGELAGTAQVLNWNQLDLNRPLPKHAVRVSASLGGAGPDNNSGPPSTVKAGANWSTFLGGIFIGTSIMAWWMVKSTLPPDFQARLRKFLADPHKGDLLGGENFGSTKLYDCEGRLITTLQDMDKKAPVRIQKMSHHMWKAVVASEDKNFFKHAGVDPYAVLRTIITALRLRSVTDTGGGSTLTQQLVKNYFLSDERTLRRKLVEMLLAIMLDRQLDKWTILELYLNKAYWGHGAYGIEAAAEKYFGKLPADLSLDESSLLAGILPSPENLSPFQSKEKALASRKVVLNRMVEAGYVTRKEAAEAADAPLNLATFREVPYRAPYFVDEVLHELFQAYGYDAVMKGGWKVYTTVDLDIQEYAEKMMKESELLSANEQVACTAIDPLTGAVRVMLGGRDYAKSQFNRATQAMRSPGSTFKPFVYLTALANGATLTKRIQDSVVEYKGYIPQNCDQKFHGRVTLEEALVNSLNVATVKLCHEVGINKVIDMAHACGIESKLVDKIGLALGNCELTPLEITSAYSTIAANGYYSKPHLISHIEGAKGETIYVQSYKREHVVDSEAVARLNHSLQSVIMRGTGMTAWFGRPAAGKTGTSNDNIDVWFAGYTPQLACAVWAGNDNNESLENNPSGATLAGPLWAEFMHYAHRNLPVRHLSVISDEKSKDQDKVFMVNQRERRRRGFYLSQGRAEEEQLLKYESESVRRRGAGSAASVYDAFGPTGDGPDSVIRRDASPGSGTPTLRDRDRGDGANERSLVEAFRDNRENARTERVAMEVAKLTNGRMASPSLRRGSSPSRGRRSPKFRRSMDPPPSPKAREYSFSTVGRQTHVPAPERNVQIPDASTVSKEALSKQLTVTQPGTERASLSHVERARREAVRRQKEAAEARERLYRKRTAMRRDLVKERSDKEDEVRDKEEKGESGYYYNPDSGEYEDVEGVQQDPPALTSMQVENVFQTTPRTKKPGELAPAAAAGAAATGAPAATAGAGGGGGPKSKKGMFW